MSPRAAARALLFVITLLTVACDEGGISAPLVLPSGAVPFEAPAIYTRWWHDVESCSGRTGDLQRVNWLVVPNSTSFELAGTSYDGYWFEYRHQIVLPSSRVTDSLVVRHEMLHDLLNDGGHPREFFVERCGVVLGVAPPTSDRAPIAPAPRG